MRRQRRRARPRARCALAGRHNVANALAAIAVGARARGARSRVAADALATFRGIERRFEVKGEVAGVRVVDDYGHHPAEIRATLAAARSVHAGRIVVVFQPHRYTRTRDLFDDFAAAFDDADLLVLTEIYAAGEAEAARRRSGAARRGDPRARPPRRALRARPRRVVAELLRRAAARRPRAHARRRQRDRARAEAARRPSRRRGRDRARAARASSRPRCPARPLRRAGEPLTSLRVGGPADALATPPDRSALARAARALREAHAAPARDRRRLQHARARRRPRRRGDPALARSSALEERPDGCLRAEAGVSHASLTRFCMDRGLAASSSARASPARSAAGSR